MLFTQSQKTTLKNHVAGNTTVISTPQGNVQIKDVPVSVDTYDEVTAWYNGLVTPDYFIFKGVVKLSDVMSNGFDWQRVDNAAAGKARIWEWMMDLSKETNGISPWKITILKGVGEAWIGNTPTEQTTHRRNILRSHFPKLCRRWEQLFVIAADDWNVASNGDKTGARGLVTNPDIMPLDAANEYLSGLVPKILLVDAVQNG